jgi:hypothetical protein
MPHSSGVLRGARLAPAAASPNSGTRRHTHAYTNAHVRITHSADAPTPGASQGLVRTGGGLAPRRGVASLCVSPFCLAKEVSTQAQVAAESVGTEKPAAETSVVCVCASLSCSLSRPHQHTCLRLHKE